MTDFPIHQVDHSIDTGGILCQELHIICHPPSLGETVRDTLVVLRERIPDALRHACEDYATLKAECRGLGTPYTTPTLLQFLVMLRNDREMFRAARKAPQVAARDNTRDTDAR